MRPALSELETAILNEDEESVKRLLPHVTLTPRTSEKLLGMASECPSLFSLLLARLPKPDGVLALTRKTCFSLTKRSQVKKMLNEPSLTIMPKIILSERTTAMLIKDERIKTEELTTSQIRAFVWALSNTIANGVFGFVIGASLAGEVTSRKMLGTIIEGTSTYSLVCRHILLKRPDAHELLLWMSQQNNVHLKLASGDALVLDSRVIAFRMLYLAALNANPDLEEMIETMREEGHTQESISLSAKLVGLYRGARYSDSFTRQEPEV